MNVPTRSADACCSSCAPTSSQDTALAIACTLAAGDFRKRVEGIRDLARRSLIMSERKPLELYLTYARDALAEVEHLVAKEVECCAFLGFKVDQNGGAVNLTITAPVDALAAADELFAHFAPELARVAA